MSFARFAKLYAIAMVTMMALDGLWLGVIAKSFYAVEMGHLTRSDVQWLPALLFYVIYAGAVVELVVRPALERRSVMRAAALGALMGLASYGAFDLTGLAMFTAFPPLGAVVDLAWGVSVTTIVSVVVTRLSMPRA